MTMEQALSEALGRPHGRGLLPTARSEAWGACRRSLESALAHLGIRVRVRSAARLWQLLRPGRLPGPGATWDQLCGQAFIRDVVTAFTHEDLAPGVWRLSSWNARWLLDPHSDAAAGKRAVIARLLAQGRVVALQETHWSDDADAAVWEGALPGATLVHSLHGLALAWARKGE